MATEFKVTVKASGGDYTSAGSVPMGYSFVTSVAGSYTSLSGDIADATSVTWSGGSGTLVHLTSVSKSGSDMFLIRSITGTALSNGTTVSGGGQSFVVSGTPTEGVQLTIEANVVGDTAFFSQPSSLVTSSTCYIKMVTPSSARHSGYWNTSKAYFTTSEIRGRYANHVKLEGLQIITSSTTAALRLDYFTASDCLWEIDSCIIRSASYRGISYGYATNPPIIKVRNTVLDQAGTYSAYAAAAGTAYFHNCTFRNAGDRTLRSSNSSANTYLKNCLLDNGSGTGVDIYIQSGNVYLDHVATGDDTADDSWTNTTKLRTGTTTSDGSGDNTLRDSGTTFPGVKVGMRVYRTTATTSYANVTSIAQASSGILGVSTNVFGNGIGYEIGAVYINASVSWVGTDDSHLQSGDTAARGKGKDLSSDSDYPVTVDIDGNSRSTWDLGADEYAGAATLSASDNIPTSEYAIHDAVVDSLSVYDETGSTDYADSYLESLSSTLSGFDNIGTFDTYSLDVYSDISEDSITVEEYISFDLSSQSIGAYDELSLAEYIPNFESNIFILSYEELPIAEYVPNLASDISILAYEEFSIADYTPDLAGNVFFLAYEEFGNAEYAERDLSSGQYAVIVNDIELLFGYTPLVYDDIAFTEFAVTSGDATIEIFENLSLLDVYTLAIYSSLIADNIGIEEYVSLSGVADFGIIFDNIGSSDTCSLDVTYLTYDELVADDVATILGEASVIVYDEIRADEYAVIEAFSDLNILFENIGSDDIYYIDLTYLTYDDIALDDYSEIFAEGSFVAYDEIGSTDLFSMEVFYSVPSEGIFVDEYVLSAIGIIAHEEIGYTEYEQNASEVGWLNFDDVPIGESYAFESGLIEYEPIAIDDTAWVYLPEILYYETISVTEDASYSIPGESAIAYESPSPADDIVLLAITGIYYDELMVEEYYTALGVASESPYDDLGLGEYILFSVEEAQYESILTDDSVTLGVSHIAYDEYHIDDAYLTDTTIINYETLGVSSDQYQLYTPGGYAVDDAIHAEDWSEIYVYTEVTDESTSAYDNLSMDEYVLLEHGFIVSDEQGSTDYAYNFIVGFNVESYESVYAESEYYSEAITDLQFEDFGITDDRQLFDVGYCQVFDDLSIADECLYGSATSSYEDMSIEDAIYTHGGLLSYDDIGIIEFVVNGDLFAEKEEFIDVEEYVLIALQAWNPVQIIANRYSVDIVADRYSISIIANHQTADFV